MFTQDNKSLPYSYLLKEDSFKLLVEDLGKIIIASTLAQDSRTAAAMLTQDIKTTSGNLWSSGIFPWRLDFTWLWQGNGQLLTLDVRH